MPRGDFDVPDRPDDAPGVREPAYQVGIYKTFDEIPPKYRVKESEFVDGDPFDDYLATRDDLAESTKKNSWYPCRDRFKKYMAEEVGRHYATARPDDIEGYLTHIRDGGYSIKVTERKFNTVYYQHLSPLKTFFAWLVNHVDYPHVYNPVIMAALKPGSTTREVWYWQIDYKSEYSDRDNE